MIARQRKFNVGIVSILDCMANMKQRGTAKFIVVKAKSGFARKAKGGFVQSVEAKSGFPLGLRA